jgi:putative flippase GtrA
MKITIKFIRYSIVGTVTTLEGWFLVYVFTEYLLGTHYIVSSMIATPIVWITAFLLNYYWTWGINDDREIALLNRLFEKIKKCL